MAESDGKQSLERRRELSDAPAKTLLLFAVGLTVALAATLAFVWLQYRAVMNVSPFARGTDASAWSYAERELEGIAEAQAALKAEEARNLQSYDWIDRDAGRARIPIERALRIVAEQGLPEWGALNPRLRPIDMVRAKADEDD